MKSLVAKLGLVLVLIATSTLSFFFFIRRFEFITPRAIYVPQVLSQIANLELCLSKNGNTNTACIDAARLVVQDLPRARFEVFKQSIFDVHVERNTLVFHKKDCGPADFAITSFVWALFPLEAKVLPNDRKAAGYFTGTEDFSTKGILVDGQCLLTVKFPTVYYVKFEAGQYNVRAGKWVWFVNGL
ncbi:MAG: hypothetical protein HOO99_02885 [Hyphomicrobiaceae bacterium]|nr:hypothetical protein [Hyphomicrobiaceae bacterium]